MAQPVEMDVMVMITLALELSGISKIADLLFNDSQSEEIIIPEGV